MLIVKVKCSDGTEYEVYAKDYWVYDNYIHILGENDKQYAFYAPYLCMFEIENVEGDEEE